MATNVYFGVCPNVPADFKTGSPTITISSGVATFSVAQTDSIMGIGAVIDYDTDNKNTYISGKISTSQWSVVNADGTTPGDVTDKTVNSITHPFTSISSAEAGVGTLMGGTNLNILDLILNLPQYCEQSSYTIDSSATLWTNLINDSSHLITLYTPEDTNTECNLSMRPTTGWDSKKPRNIININNGRCQDIRSSTRESYRVFLGMQLKAEYPASACFNLRYSNNITIIRRCILVNTNDTSSIYIKSNTKLFLRNNICYNTTPNTTNSFILGTTPTGTDCGDSYVYGNIIIGYGRFWSIDIPGIHYFRNNLILGTTLENVLDSGSITAQDNNMWRGVNSASNTGLPDTDIETTKSDAQLFKSTSGGYDNYDWRPSIYRAPQVDSGYDLSSSPGANSSDFNHDAPFRPLGRGWDIGAFELQEISNSLWVSSNF